MDALVVVFPTPPLPEVTTIVLVKLPLPKEYQYLERLYIEPVFIEPYLCGFTA